MSIRVLVYLEPCVFRDDPLFLRGHLERFINPVVDALSIDSKLDFLGFASNMFLCLEGLNHCRALASNPREVKVYPLYNADILAQFGFCLEEYARDLFDPDCSALSNQVLEQRISLVMQDARPDIVITTSQNRYLSYVSRVQSVPVLNIEFGPLPRLVYPDNRFLSFDGHLSAGAFSSPSRLHSAIKSMDTVGAPQSIREFNEGYLRSVRAHPQHDEIRSLIHKLRGEGAIALLALQPEQWITWEGALGKRRSAVSIIHESLARMQSDRLIVTFHADKRGQISPESLREVWLTNPKLQLMPAHLSSGLTEVFLPYVDELLTVSSNVAMSAFLLGKTVLGIGDSFVKTLERVQLKPGEAGAAVLRGVVLRFVMERMSVDDATFSNPALLRQRLDQIFSRTLTVNCDSASGLGSKNDELIPDLDDDVRYPDMRRAELSVIHATIVDLVTRVDAPSSFLLQRFGRHALGYMLHPGATGAEFGVAKGYFSESLLRSGRFRCLYSIDRWSDHHDDEEYSFVRDRLAPFGENSQVMRMSFHDALSVIPEKSLDFIYVDGYAHTGQDAEIARQALSKLKPGGLIAMHDYDKFSWPLNFEYISKLFDTRAFSELQIVNSVLTSNNEDAFPGLVARYIGNQVA